MPQIQGSEGGAKNKGGGGALLRCCPQERHQCIKCGRGGLDRGGRVDTPHTTPDLNGGPGAPTSTLPLPPMLGAAEARNVTVEFLENSKTSPWRALINPWKKQPQTQPEKAMEVKLGHFMVALLTALESAGGTGKLTETIATAG